MFPWEYALRLFYPLELLKNVLPQTTVSIASVFLHENKGIFPKPKEFIPERWLESNSRELESYLVPFSRGPRSCLGIK